MVFKILCCLLLFKVAVSQEIQSNRNLTVQYYVDVIEDGIAESLSYPMPDSAAEYRPRLCQNKPTEFGTFDYIIVGAGSAGAVIATRLSEDRHLKILLLEAGGAENSFADIPAEKLYMVGTKYNWNFQSTPQNTSCLGMINRECAIPRGKGLGGSTIINAIMYVRGNRHDYDTWANLGNPGWSFDDVLPYFIKSENSQIDGDPGYHGVGGLLNVQYHRPYSPEFYAFVDANVKLGRKVVDYNGKHQLGVARVQHNIVNGMRLTVARAFLSYAWFRNNLKVLSHSYVTKVLIDTHKSEAYGVQFSHKNQLYIARASREVIISAGAFGSPQLLLLSGIGPAAHLNDLKIPVIKDLPVGQYLQDHSYFCGLLFTSNYTAPIRSTAEYVEEFLDSYGPLTIAENAQGLVFVQTKLAKIPGVPDVEIMMIPANATSSAIQRAFHYTDETYNAIWARLNPANTFTIYPIVIHPKSYGSVKLRSADPYVYPLINTNFLSDPNNIDIETLYQGTLLSLEIANQAAFRRLNATLVDGTLPPCRRYEYLSRDYWFCQIRQLTTHMYHPIGTCRMGPNPNNSVVDHNLRVHGIKRLRVADASVFPSTTSGHTSAPAIMVGEKVSDLIRNRGIDPRCVNY